MSSQKLGGEGILLKEVRQSSSYLVHSMPRTHKNKTPLWHTRMGFYSAIKGNAIMTFSGQWMKLEVIRLSEISQPQEEKCFLLYTQSVCMDVHRYLHTRHM